VATGPNILTYRQPPLQSSDGWDNLGDVHATLRQLEIGYFRSAAIMWDAMFRDDRKHAVVRTRLHALQSVPLDIKAAGDSPKAVELAEQLGGIEDTPGLWDQMFSAPAVGELVKWGFAMGIGVGELVWDTTDKGWTPRLRVWHPQFLRWDSYSERYLLQTQMGTEVVLPDIRTQPMSDGHWILWCPYGYHGAWLQGLVRPAGTLVLDRTWNRHDWSRYNERYGKPIEKAIAPVSAPKEARDAHFQAVAARHGESAVLCETGFDDNGHAADFDVELVESKSTGWDTFQARKKEDDADLAILLLGQSMTTETPDGKGSLATGPSNMVRLDYLKADAGVLGAIYEQGVKWWAVHNGGAADFAPRPCYRTDPPEDTAGIATAKATIITGLAAAESAHLPVDARAELEAAGIATISVEEEAAKKALRDEHAAQIAGQRAGGGGGGEPGSDLGEEDDDKAAAAGGGGKGRAELAAKKAPNVVKRYRFQGLDIAVENERGTVRQWLGGETRMQHDYGFIDNGQIGWDGDEVDVYIGPNASAPDVHVVHQLTVPTYDRYDEDKVMMGFESYDAARRAYVAHRNDGDRAIKSISTMPLAEFHRRLARRRGAGPIRAASARIETNRALMVLARRVMALRALPAGKKSAHVDRIAENATRLAAEALAGDLAAVKQAVELSTDFADLESRLLRTFKGMNPRELATVIQRARIMANLSGQLSARKETKKT